MPRFPDVVLHADPALILSSLSAADAPALAEALSDPVLRSWLPLPSPYTLAMAASWCTTISGDLRESGRGFVLAVRNDGDLVASIDAKRVDWRARSLELSYWTAAPHRGRGIMPAAVRRVADWLLEEQSFERVELRVATGNAASLRTAEKAGFVREGVARNAGFTDAGRVDLAVLSRIRTDPRD